MRSWGPGFFAILFFATLSWDSPLSFAASKNFSVCSFNIQFLGSTKNRDYEGLAELLKKKACDVVVIQELDAPPSEAYLAKNSLYPFPLFPAELFESLIPKSKRSQYAPAGVLRRYPQRFLLDPQGEAIGLSLPEPIKASEESTSFFNAMAGAGFLDFILSEEDTGINAFHVNSSASEWWVAFFNPKKVLPAEDLPHGFLSPERVGPTKPWARTPYAFPFRSKNRNFDFVLISVHLTPGASEAEKRKDEILAIQEWVLKNDSQEKDFFILGDMNLEDQEELLDALPPDFPDPGRQQHWVSLNGTLFADRPAVPTNTIPKPKSQRPYDHVFLNVSATSEQECPRLIKVAGKLEPNFQVIPLREAMRPRWQKLHPGQSYPGEEAQYDHDRFRTEYSDHQPIRFELNASGRDDD